MMKFIGETAYFSHPKITYNTKLEKKILKLLPKYFDGRIICPNHDIGHLKNSKEYLTISEKSDCIFLLPSPQNKGYISAGCFHEVNNALENSIPVYAVFLKKKKIKFKVVHYTERENTGDLNEFALIETYKLF